MEVQTHKMKSCAHIFKEIPAAVHWEM